MPKLLPGALAILLVGAGCVSASTMQQANTVGKGRAQFAAEVSMLSLPLSEQDRLKVPVEAFAARWGVSETTDLGFRVGVNGVEALTKFQLTPPTSDFVISIAPSAGAGLIWIPGLFGSKDTVIKVVDATLPVLIGIPVGRHQIVLAPSLRDFAFFGDGSDSGNTFCAGASLGFAVRVTDSFKLLPEVSVLYPLNRAEGTSDEPHGFNSRVTYSVGLGVIWGNSR